MLYNFQLLSYNMTPYVLYDPATIDLKVSFKLLLPIDLFDLYL